MRTVLLVLAALAVIAGVAVPIQFAANARMGQAAGGPVTAATISFFIGTAVLLLVVVGILLVGRGESPALPSTTTVPWWAWSGGFLGAFYVSMSIVLTPRLGASPTIGFIIGGQMIASIVLDHFGLLNLPTSPATLPKLSGAALVVIGSIIVLSSRQG
ncbi:MAG: DMT family transporter [Rubrobacter sp.]|nr:DMT family transporter [Rubrobacter sp.]